MKDLADFPTEPWLSKQGKSLQTIPRVRVVDWLVERSREEPPDDYPADRYIVFSSIMAGRRGSEVKSSFHAITDGS
jgi:hypothetical protein